MMLLLLVRGAEAVAVLVVLAGEEGASCDVEWSAAVTAYGAAKNMSTGKHQSSADAS